MALSYDFRVLHSRQSLINVLGVREEQFDAVLAFNPMVEAGVPLPSGGVRIVDIPMFVRHDIPKKNNARGHSSKRL